MQGIIDEPKVYNAALTAVEIKMDMNNGNAQALGSLSDTSGLTGGSVASNSAAAAYCVPGASDNCSDPIGEWKFEEGQGTTVRDTSGNGKDGTWTSSEGKWSAGNFGKAGKFINGTDYVNVPASGNVKSVSFWVKPTILLDDLMQLNGSTAYIYQDGSGGVTTGAGFTSPVKYINGMVNGALKVNQWNFVVISTNTNINASAPKFGFANIGNALVGEMDNIVFYDYQRTAAQVAWEYNRGKPIALWKMDECQGSALHDSVGNVSTTTLIIGGSGTQTAVGTCGTSGTAWGNGATGKMNASLKFDGTDDYAYTSYFSPLASSGTTTTKFSWGGWFYPTTSAASKTLVEKATEFQLITDANSKPTCGIYYTGAFHNATAGNVTLTLSAWNHVLCTYDGININTYLNGVLIGQTAQTNVVTAASSILYMGENSAGGSKYNGQIDDVRIYNYPLTASQVKTIQNGDSALKFGPSSGTP